MSAPIHAAIKALQASPEPFRHSVERMLRGSTCDPHPDTDLFDLEQRRAAAQAAYDAAVARVEAADDAATVPVPAALFARGGDFELGLAHHLADRGDGRRGYWLDGANPNTAKLRWPRKKAVTRPVQPEGRLPKDAQTVTEYHPWPEAQARADEIISAWDGWIAETRARHEAAGCDAAEAECERLGRALDVVNVALAAAVPRTLAGLAVKAQAVRRAIDRDDDVGHIAAILVKDITALAETAA